MTSLSGQNKGSVPEQRGSENHVSRRMFIGKAVKGAAAVSVIGGLSRCAPTPIPPRSNRANLFLENGKTLLVVVEGTNMKKMIEAGLDKIGGLGRHSSAKHLTVKTNTDSADPYPVNIDLELAHPLVQCLQDFGVEGITFCDAPTTGINKDRAFAGLGYFDLEKQKGVKVVAGDAGAKSQYVSVRDERWEACKSVGVFRPLHEASFIINAVVPKRHVAARFTCALKNHFGSVYGPERWAVHREGREESSGVELFDKALVEFADAVRPELTIVDARSLLTRHGPKIRGRSEVKDGVNKLILCGDMVAADRYCADLMKKYDDTFDPEMIALQLEYAEKIGLGTLQKDQIEFIEVSA